MSRGKPSPAEERRHNRVVLALANVAFFGEYYVRPFDENWTGPLPRLAVEYLAFAKSVRRGVLMTPPETLKTTMVSQVYPLYLTARYAVAGKLGLLSGMLLSEEQDLAERNLSVVAWHIQHNARLREDFVDRHGRPLLEPDPDEDKWTDDALVLRRPGVSKDPTWSAKGLKSKGIQGKRLRHLIGDDVVTPASAHSPAVQKEAKRIWDQQVTSRVKAEGQAIIAGNFNHPKDLLSELAGRNSYAVMRRPTLHTPGDVSKAPENPRDPEAVVTIPEVWPRERLMRDLAEKPFSFPTIHLLRASSEKGARLKEEWVRRITLDDVPVLERLYLIGIDPAPGAEVDPDPSFFSLAIGCLTPKHLDVLESYAGRMEPTEQVELLAAKVDEYSEKGHVGGLALAKIALDRYFGGAVLVGHPELRPLLHAHSLPEGSKVERLSHLGSYFKSGWARITETAWSNTTDDPDHREQDESFGEQWIALPNQNHDDRLDAVDVLIREARERMGAGRAEVAAEAEPGRDPSLTGDLLEKPM